jgi:hypothetical protein
VTIINSHTHYVLAHTRNEHTNSERGWRNGEGIDREERERKRESRIMWQ